MPSKQCLATRQWAATHTLPTMSAAIPREVSDVVRGTSSPARGRFCPVRVAAFAALLFEGDRYGIGQLAVDDGDDLYFSVADRPSNRPDN